MKTHTLLTLLLALKADDRGVDREELVREILKTMKEMEDQLPDEKKALVHHFLETYHQLSQKNYQTIQEEENMTIIADSITEYFELYGKKAGKKAGKKEGKSELLLKQLKKRFGKIPEWAQKKLEKANPRKLESWGLKLLDAQTLEEVLQ